MKKIITLLAIAIACLASCTEDLEKEYSISLKPTKLSFNSEGGKRQVSLESTYEWEVNGGDNWCSVSPRSGEGDAEVVFTIEPNMAAEDRSAEFVFTSGNEKTTLTVTQEKKEYSISIEPTELKFGSEGGEQEITVTSSNEWEVKGESEWCDISVTSGNNGDKVTFSADPYTNTKEARTAAYTFFCGDKEVELSIEQEAKVYSISVEPTELSFIAAGEEKTVTITSSDEWEFSSDEYWIKTSERSGENGASVKIIVDENTDPEIRTGIATFKCGDKQANVKITQESKVFLISVEPAELNFDKYGGEQKITVTSSDEWTLRNSNDWITTSAESGQNGDVVTISVASSLSEEDWTRRGIVYFTCGQTTDILIVNQKRIGNNIIQFKDPYFEMELLERKQSTINWNGVEYKVNNVDKNGDGKISELEAAVVKVLEAV